MEAERRDEQVDGVRPGSIAAGSLHLLLARVAASAATFGAYVILARALVPSDRGAVAFVMTAGIVLAAVSGFGLDSATTVFAARSGRSRPSLFVNLSVFSLLAGVLVGGAFALFLVLAEPIRPTGLGSLALLALVLGTAGLRLNMSGAALLQGCRRFRDQAVVTTVPPVLLAALVFGLWRASDVTVQRACVVWAVAQLVGAGIGVIAASRASGVGAPSITLFRETLAYGLRAWTGSVAGMLNARVDQILMGFISSEAQLGYYAVAVNASDVALYLPTTVTQVIVPSIARAGEIERVETTLRIFRMLLLLTTGVVIVGLACTPLIPLVFGSAYSPSITPYVWLLPGAVAAVAYAVFTSSLFASSAPGRSTVGPLASLVVGLGLDILLIPPLGATGAAIAATAAFTAGGTAAALTYTRLSNSPVSLLVPRRGDLVLLRGLGRRFMRRRPRSAAHGDGLDQ